VAKVCPKCLETIDDDDAVSCPECGAIVGVPRLLRQQLASWDAADPAPRGGRGGPAAVSAPVPPAGNGAPGGMAGRAAVEDAARLAGAATGLGDVPPPPGRFRQPPAHPGPGAPGGTAVGPPLGNGRYATPVGARPGGPRPVPAAGRAGGAGRTGRGRPRRALRIGRGGLAAQIVIYVLLAAVVIGLVLAMVLLTSSATGSGGGPSSGSAVAHVVPAGAR